MCPTGIDIRKGSQLECVQCAACVDACDEIMTKLSRPKGLVRYATEAEIMGRAPRYLRPRVVIYALALLGVVGALVTTVSMTPQVEVHATRMVGSPYEVMGDGRVKNAGNLRVTSHLQTAVPVHLELAEGSPASLELITPLPRVEVEPSGVVHLVFFLMQPQQGAAQRARLRVSHADTGEPLGVAEFRLLSPERAVGEAPAPDLPAPDLPAGEGAR